MTRVKTIYRLCLVILGVGLLPYAASSEGPVGSSPQEQPPRKTRVIDGSREPELLPEAIVWEGAFAALHDLTGGKRDPSDPEVWGFVKNNLHISAKDAAILLEGVARARSGQRTLERQLDLAFHKDNDPGEVSRLKEEIDQLILDHRDRILTTLSPRGAKALHRYIAIIKRGMKVEIPE